MNCEYDKKGRLKIPVRFPFIERDALLPCDIFVFYNKKVKKFSATWWARFHGRYSDKTTGRVTNPPYHANIMYRRCGEDTLLADTELRTTLSHIEEYLDKKDIRIDVIRYPKVTPKARRKIQAWLKKITIEEPLYDFQGYGSFVREMPPYLSWLGKFIPKQKKNTWFCSELVGGAYKSEGYDITDKKSPAPRDLIRCAMLAQQKDVDSVGIYTLKVPGEVL